MVLFRLHYIQKYMAISDAKYKQDVKEIVSFLEVFKIQLDTVLSRSD